MHAGHALQVIAGPRARLHIEQHGLRPDDIRVMVGASGGPKWLCLAALDEYLFGEFFAGRDQPLDLLGSSSGAWRFACLAQQEPVAALRRFRDAYHQLRFPGNADREAITRVSKTLLNAILPTRAHEQAVLDNDVFRLHFMVGQARGLAAGRHPIAQAAGMALSALANGVDRRALGLLFRRVLFHAPRGRPPFYDLDDLPTDQVALNEGNLRDAIMASASIPMVLNPVNHIAGAGTGPFYDGGITDYHFDIPFADEGLVLYPHFYPEITPGWFDKKLRRGPSPENYDNVIMLCPSADWVASLPYGRIPDRRDFQRLRDDEREAAWGEAIARSQELVDDFKHLLNGEWSLLN